MQFSLLALTAALASLVSAQSLGSVPACAAQACVTKLLPASCNTNPECICKDTNFITNISCCVFQNCSPADQTAALDFAKTICNPVGVTLPAQASCSGNETVSASASGSSSSSLSYTGTATSTNSASRGAGSQASSAVSAASSSASSAAATSSGAAEKIVAHGMGLVGAVVGAVALL